MEPVRATREVESDERESTLWFRRLDVEGARSFRPEVSLPGPLDGLLSRLGGALDIGIAGPLSLLPAFETIPGFVSSFFRPGMTLQRWSFYSDPEFLEDPDSFFEQPPAGLEPARRKCRSPLAFRPDDGDVWNVFFASPFEPRYPEIRAKYLSHGGNQISHARYWRHHGGPRPTAIVVHPFIGSQPTVNTELFNLRYLYRLGLDVLLFVMPFHGPRTKGTPLPDFPGGDLAWNAEAFAHGVYDLRVWLTWLRDMGSPEVGIIGASLGGYLAALFAGLEERLSFSVPIMPVTSFADMMWTVGGKALEFGLSRIGWGLDDLRRQMALHTPLQYGLRIPRERAFIVSGVGDRLAAPYQAKLLSDAWDGAAIHWYAGSHLLHVGRGKYLGDVAGFLADEGIIDPPNRAAGAAAAP